MQMNRTAMAWVGTLVLATGVALAGAQTSSPVKDDLFAGTEKFATGASDVTEVTMDPDTLDMVGGRDARRARNMVLNVVRTYEYPKPGMYNIADVEAIRQRLNTGDWHCSVHTRDLKNGESTDICNKHRTDGLVEQAIITVEPKELTFIHQIRRPYGGESGSPGASGGSGPSGSSGDSVLVLPGMNAEMEARMAELTPEMEARMAELTPEMEARMATIGPEIQARMAALQPEMEARMAVMQAKIAAATKQLQSQGLDKGK